MLKFQNIAFQNIAFQNIAFEVSAQDKKLILSTPKLLLIVTPVGFNGQFENGICTVSQPYIPKKVLWNVSFSLV